MTHIARRRVAQSLGRLLAREFKDVRASGIMGSASSQSGSTVSMTGWNSREGMWGSFAAGGSRLYATNSHGTVLE